MDAEGTRSTLASLVARRVLDAELAALAWLLIEDGVPVVVVGSAPLEERVAVASALVSVDARQAALVLDADADPPTVARLSALLQGGARVGLVLAAADLEAALEHLHGPPAALPYDAIRRLGVVLVLDRADGGARVSVAHYLRPTERDAQGHVQRRAPAVLAAWEHAGGTWEHYAWGILPELADRVGRTQSDLEQRQLDRVGFLVTMARHGPMAPAEWRTAVSRYLATEATRTPAVRDRGSAPKA
jgi:hypothetical protein